MRTKKPREKLICDGRSFNSCLPPTMELLYTAGALSPMNSPVPGGESFHTDQGAKGLTHRIGIQIPALPHRVCSTWRFFFLHYVWKDRSNATAESSLNAMTLFTVNRAFSQVNRSLCTVNCIWNEMQSHVVDIALSYSTRQVHPTISLVNQVSKIKGFTPISRLVNSKYHTWGYKHDDDKSFSTICIVGSISLAHDIIARQTRCTIPRCMSAHSDLNGLLYKPATPSMSFPSSFFPHTKSKKLQLVHQNTPSEKPRSGHLELYQLHLLLFSSASWFLF